MRSLSLDFDPLIGPIVRVQVGLPTTLALANYNKGLAVPAKVQCDALIDTGSTGVVVNPDILDESGITDYVQTTAHGVDGVVEVKTAAISLSVLDMDGKILVGFHEITAIRPIHRLPDGQQCLLGRSVLSKFELRYNGGTNHFELSTVV